MKRTFLLLSALLAAQSSVAFSQVGGIPGSGKGMNKRLGLAQKNAETLNEYNFETEEVLKESGARGYVQFGLDTVTFDNRVSDRNQAYPYVKVEAFPFNNSNIYLDVKTAYRFDYNKAHNNYLKSVQGNKPGQTSLKTEYGQSNAVYTEFNIGSFYRNGNFYINYKAGFNNYNFDNVKLAYRREYRFIPKASYDFTENFSWYLKGYLGYVEAEETVNVKAGSNGKPPITKEVEHNKYLHKLESGFSYLLHDNLRLTLGVLNRTKEKYAGQYIEWMYLSKLDYNLYSSDSLQIRPYFWYLYSPEVQSGLNLTTGPQGFKNEEGTKLGVKVDYDFAQNWTFEADAFWYRTKNNVQGSGGGQGQGQSITRKYENAGIVRVSLKKYF